MRLLVDATFRQVRHLVEKYSQVQHSVEIVKSLFFDQTSYSTERRIYQMLLIIKKENHKKSLSQAIGKPKKLHKGGFQYTVDKETKNGM